MIGRLDVPLLQPDANEREGYVPNVVYSCGGVLHNRELIIPYAMSDYASTFATVSLDEVLEAMVRAVSGVGDIPSRTVLHRPGTFRPSSHEVRHFIRLSR